jgi:hypothetical protein
MSGYQHLEVIYSLQGNAPIISVKTQDVLQYLLDFPYFCKEMTDALAYDALKEVKMTRRFQDHRLPIWDKIGEMEFELTSICTDYLHACNNNPVFKAQLGDNTTANHPVRDLLPHSICGQPFLSCRGSGRALDEFIIFEEFSIFKRVGCLRIHNR